MAGSAKITSALCNSSLQSAVHVFRIDLSRPRAPQDPPLYCTGRPLTVGIHVLHRDQCVQLCVSMQLLAKSVRQPRVLAAGHVYYSRGSHVQESCLYIGHTEMPAAKSIALATSIHIMPAWPAGWLGHRFAIRRRGFQRRV